MKTGLKSREYQTGVTIYDPSKGYISFVCFSAMDGNTHLIDMKGTEVHPRSHLGLPGEIISPILTGGERGHVFLQPTDGEDKRGGIFSNGTISELDCSGKILWNWGMQA